MVGRNAVGFQQVKGRHGGEKDDLKAGVQGFHPLSDGQRPRKMAETHTVCWKHDNTIPLGQGSSRPVRFETSRL